MYKINKQSRNVEFIDFYNQNNFHVVLSNYGASIYEIQVPNDNSELETITLTPESKFYFNNNKYFGLTIGRVAGRIDNGEFTINDVNYKLKPNEGLNVLHGGFINLAYRIYNYEIKDSSKYTKVIYRTLMKDMEDGFPGNLEVKVEYTLYKLEDKIDLEYFAISDKDTLLNLTNHSYFNLCGNYKETIENHILTINKDKYSIFRDDLKLLSLKNVTKEFDFRNSKRIGKDIMNEKVLFPTGGYDHYFSDDKNLNVKLHHTKTNRTLEINSDYKDVVIYSNNFDNGTIYRGNVQDRKFLGLAIEPSRFTKILSNDGLILKANELYNYKIEYKYYKED